MWRRVCTSKVSMEHLDFRCQKPKEAPGPSKCWKSSSIVLLLKYAKFIWIFTGSVNFNEKVQLYQVTPCRIRKIWVAIVTAAMYVLIGYETMVSVQKGFHWLNTIHQLMWVVSAFIMFRLFWNCENFERLLNAMHRIETDLAANGFPYSEPNFLRFVIGAGVMTLSGLTTISICQYFYAFEDVPWSMESQVRSLELRFCDGAFPTYYNSTFYAKFTEPPNLFHVAFGTVFVGITCFGTVTELTGYVLNVAVVLSTWLLVRSFSNGLKGSSVWSKQIVLDIADDLVALFDLIETAIGDSILCMCFVNLPFYVMTLKELLKGDSHAAVSMVACLGIFLGTTIPAASLVSRFKVLPGWYKRKSVKEDGCKSGGCGNLERRFDLFMHELNGNKVGISGKMFTISYSFIGQILGLSLTYAIVLLQYNREVDGLLRHDFQAL